MSKFFVGQKVRIVGSEWVGSGASPKGMEGRIVGRGVVGRHTKRVYDWAVEIAIDILAADSADLEPILPEGAAPSEYSFQQLMDSLQEVSV